MSNKMLCENYNKCQSSLKKFILKLAEENEYTNEELEKFIEECMLDTVLSHLLNDKKKISMHYRQVGQKERNEIISEEIRCIANEAQNEGIKLVLLKGVVFARKYYDIPEKRIGKDIDLLIKGNDFVRFIEICKRNGYELARGGEIEEYEIQRYANDLLRDQHFLIISKQVGKTKVYMDIHVGLIQQHWFGGNCEEIPKEFYQRSIDVNMPEFGAINIFEPHDLLIYLSIHFIQHFYVKIWQGFIDANFYLVKKITLLFDIACMLETEKIRYNWDYFYDLCVYYHVEIELASVLSFLKDVFGEVFPNDIIARLKNAGMHYEKNKFYSSICQYSLHKGLSYMLARPTADWLCEYVESVIISKKTFYIKKKERIEQNGGRQLTLEGSFAYGMECVAEKLKLNVCLNWDEDELYISVKAECGGMPFKEYLKDEKQSVNRQDYMEFAFHGFEYWDYPKEIKRVAIEYSRSGSDVTFSSNYKSSMVNMEKKVMQLRIPWVDLDFKPCLDKAFGFSLIWTHFDKEEIEGYTRMSLSGNSVWHDVAGMLKVGFDFA